MFLERPGECTATCALSAHARTPPYVSLPYPETSDVSRNVQRANTGATQDPREAKRDAAKSIHDELEVDEYASEDAHDAHGCGACRPCDGA